MFQETNNALFDTDGTFSFDGKKWLDGFQQQHKINNI
jgi:hypothetical protein